MQDEMGEHHSGWLQYVAAGISKWKRGRNRRKTHDNIIPKGETSSIKPLDQHQLQCPNWDVGEVKMVQVYTAPRPSPAETKCAHDIDLLQHKIKKMEAPLHDFLHLHSCEVEFDPQKDYAQVLAEARSHLKVANALDNNNATSSPLNHLDAYKELQSKLGKPHKPSKLRRLLFFWQRPSIMSQQQMEAEFESIFSSPPHPTLKISQNGMYREARKEKKNSSTERSTRKGISGPLDSHARCTRRNNSGPLYTDGLPVGPFNIKISKKSYSGPLGPMSCSNMDSYLSPYQLLQRPPSSSPLYSC